jgi:hypothetical protein
MKLPKCSYVIGILIAAGVLYPFFGWQLSPIIAAGPWPSARCLLSLARCGYAGGGSGAVIAAASAAMSRGEMPPRLICLVCLCAKHSK